MQSSTLDNCNKEEQATVFQKLIKPIEAVLTEQNEKLPKHPNQKYEYYDFCILLVYYFTSEVSSLKLLVNGLLNKGLLAEDFGLWQVSYSTCNEAFGRFPIYLFPEIFQHLLKTLHFKNIQAINGLGYTLLY